MLWLSVTTIHFSSASPASSFSKFHSCMFSKGKEPWKNGLLILDLFCCPPFVKKINFIQELWFACQGNWMAWFANEVSYKENLKLAYTTWYSSACNRRGINSVSLEEVAIGFFWNLQVTVHSCWSLSLPRYPLHFSPCTSPLYGQLLCFRHGLSSMEFF